MRANPIRIQRFETPREYEETATLDGAVKDAIVGAASGFVATGPMTVAMFLMYRLLPWWEKAPLPPSQVTSAVLDAAGLNHIDENYHQTATFAGHFAYGAMTGALYPLVDKLPLPTVLKGTLYGAGVWFASYVGWLPQTGLLESATERPRRRNLLMIAAHTIWGISTALLYRLLASNPLPGRYL